MRRTDYTAGATATTVRCSITGSLGTASLAGSPADFGRFIAAEAEKWSKVIRAANIKVD
jgi:hypothetical protein